MNRNVLRGEAAQAVGKAERPLGDAFQSISTELMALPRRQQAWVRFDAFPLAGQLLVTPYSCAAVLVLSALSIGIAGSGITAAPWLSIEPADGIPNAVRIVATYGLPTSGPFDALLEYVEDTSPVWSRSNVTGGQP